jgi:hypothetical protein
LQRWQHPSWTGERLGFELVSTPNVSRQAKRGSRYLCRLKFKAVPATIVQIALVSFDSCQHAGTAEFVHVNNFKAVQRQQQLDRTQQTFDAAASVAQSIMAQVEGTDCRVTLNRRFSHLVSGAYT